MSNWLEGTISQYSVQASGALTPMTRATVATGPQPYQIAVARDGHSLYVTDEHFIVESSETREGSVSQFTIGPDGSLAPKTPATVPAGVEPKGILISPSGANLYVADSTETGQLSQFSIGPDGTLAAMTPSAIGAGRQPYGLAVGLDGRHLYVSNSAEYTIGEYEIEDGGALRAMSLPTARAGEWPMSVVLVETEREPPLEREESKETEPPLKRCHETSLWSCREPEPPRQCLAPEPPPDFCCRSGPGEVEPQYEPKGCCRSGPGEVEPQYEPKGCCRSGPGEVEPQYEPKGCCRSGPGEVEPQYEPKGCCRSGPGEVEPLLTSRCPEEEQKPDQGEGGGEKTDTPEVLPKDTTPGLGRTPPLDGSRAATRHAGTAKRNVNCRHKKGRKERRLCKLKRVLRTPSPKPRRAT